MPALPGFAVVGQALFNRSARGNDQALRICAEGAHSKICRAHHLPGVIQPEDARRALLVEVERSDLAVIIKKPVGVTAPLVISRNLASVIDSGSDGARR